MFVLKAGPDIKIRKVKLADCEKLFEIISSQKEYIGKWLPFAYTTESVKDVENHYLSNKNKENYCSYDCVVLYNNAVVGKISIVSHYEGYKTVEIGYFLSEDFQKKGIISRSFGVFCDFIFENLDVEKVVVKCAVGNDASAKIPKRFGFQFERIEYKPDSIDDNIFFDFQIYSRMRN